MHWSICICPVPEKYKICIWCAESYIFSALLNLYKIHSVHFVIYLDVECKVLYCTDSYMRSDTVPWWLLPPPWLSKDESVECMSKVMRYWYEAVVNDSPCRQSWKLRDRPKCAQLASKSHKGLVGEVQISPNFPYRFTRDTTKQREFDDSFKVAYLTISWAYMIFIS